jgi:predicted dehydrogenase
MTFALVERKILVLNKRNDLNVSLVTSSNKVPVLEDNAHGIGVGVLGPGWMGRAHSDGYKKMPYVFWPPPAVPKLVAISGRSREKTAEAALRYGYSRYYVDWKDMLKDEEVALFDNCSSNDMHAEPCIAAANAGKHVFCEKPLARDAGEALRMLDAVRQAKVRNMVGFGFRFIPAVRFAKKLLEDGTLGRIYHYRARYLGDWMLDPKAPFTWRMDSKIAGSGVVGDLGSHIIDLGRFLIGEPTSVCALTKTFTKERVSMEGKKRVVDVEDTLAAALEFENEATGTLEASASCAGRTQHAIFEINGSRGTLEFDLERLNELRVCLLNEKPQQVTGLSDVIVTRKQDAYYDKWHPHLGGLPIGYVDTFAHEIYHLIDCIVRKSDVGPYGATFEDGYKCAIVCDAILRSSKSGKRVEIQY